MYDRQSIIFAHYSDLEQLLHLDGERWSDKTGVSRIIELLLLPKHLQRIARDIFPPLAAMAI